MNTPYPCPSGQSTLADAKARLNTITNIQVDATPVAPAVPPFNRPGVTDKFLADAGCHHYGNDDVQEHGCRPEGIAIPFRSVTGEPILDNGKPFARVRLYTATDSKKYHQRTGSETHIYIPPNFREQPRYQTLVEVEGEFKSLALSEAGFSAVGLPGISCAMREGELHPELAEVLEFHKPARVLFLGDNDTVLNSDFAREAAKLRPAIFDSKRFAFVTELRVAVCPLGGPKGVDDVRGSMGGEFNAWFSALVENAYVVPAKASPTEIFCALLRRESELVRKAITTGDDHEQHRNRVKLLQSAGRLQNEAASALLVLPLLADLLSVSESKAARMIRDSGSSTDHTKPGKKRADAKPIADDELRAAYGEPVSVFKEGGVANINERYFAGHFHAPGNILYEPAEKLFYGYEETTGIWRRESDDHIREAVSAAVLDYGRRTGLSLDSKISVARMNGIVHALRAIGEQRDAFKAARDFVHVQNGVIRFPEDGNVILTEFRRDDYSRNRSPVAFDEAAECPQFYNDLLRAALPDDDIALLQCLLGLAIAGVNPAQRLVILDGNAATGKTQIARIFQALVGAENCTQVRTALLNERFEIFRYIGKTLLLAPDVQGDFLNRAGASVLKALVGGDPLTAEAKGGNGGFDIDGNFNVLITSNTRLRVRLDGDTGAWRRRLIILRFEGKSPTRRIPNFAEKLIAEEGAGILRWALAGLLRAREQLAATGDLFLTPTQKERVEALLSESDSIRRFVAECTATGNGNVTSHELVESYFHFCSTNEWTPQPVRIVERTLADVILETHGQSRAQDIGRAGKSVRGWRNVILNTEFATA